MLLLPDQLLSFTLNELDPLIEALKTKPGPKTLVFWSSRIPETGRMWCPDCEKMEASLVEVLPKLSADSTAGLIYVYVGTRDEWKSPSNVFRHSPWNLDRIPTVLKVSPDDQLSLELRISSQESRLVEADAIDPQKLSNFLLQ